MKADNLNIPRHVAVIMDGNGRWAKKRLMPRTFGHNAGMNAMIAMARKAKRMGVRYLTVYALSTENLSRPQEELDGLYNLFRKYFTKNVKDLYAEGAAVRVIGDITALPEDVQDLIVKGIANSPADAQFFVILALNYGARAEITRAVNAAISRGERVEEGDVSALLDTKDFPDPDLIIRTGESFAFPTSFCGRRPMPNCILPTFSSPISTKSSSKRRLKIIQAATAASAKFKIDPALCRN